MEFDLDTFVENPSVDYLTSVYVRKEDWSALGSHYGIVCKKTWRKGMIQDKVINELVEREILDESAHTLRTDANSQFMKKLEAEREQRAHEVLVWKERAEERAFQIELLTKQAELGIAMRPADGTGSDTFDITRQSRLVPSFDENDPQEFFLQFEKTAMSLSWPVKYWPVLIQTNLVGRGRSAYLSLDINESMKYETIKKSVLNAYQLTPEYYRQKFRGIRKSDTLSYIELSHTVKKLGTRWLESNKVETREELEELILLEQYKRAVPWEVKVYLEEREVKSLVRAATLAENYALTHKGFNHRISHKPESKRGESKLMGGHSARNNSSTGESGPDDGAGGFKESSASKAGFFSDKKELTCYYCKQLGHIKGNCPKLVARSKFSKQTSMACNNVTDCFPCEVALETRSELFEPFQFDGFVSVSDHGKGFPVRVLRDTASSCSILLKSAVPFLEDVFTGDEVVLQGVSGAVTVPVCRVFLKTDLVSKFVDVAIQDTLPVEGVSFLLGNDVAGNKVVPNPIVTSVPTVENNTESLEKKIPGLFPSCAVTRSMKRNAEHEVHSGAADDLDILDSSELSGKFVSSEAGSDRDTDPVVIDSVPVSRDMLSEAQRSDPGLKPLFARAVDLSESEKLPVCYYLDKDVLMRKFRSADVAANEEWNVVKQIIVPVCYRKDILSLAHDFVGGHLGINKTYNKILPNFFWPGLRRDVAKYCRTCHICQVAGKPNQVLKKAPLQPIVPLTEPFKKVIIDCVGPMPKTKKGNQFLLTIMCATTRYPEAIPLKKIGTKDVVNVLLKFFTQYGIPKYVQSDQGTNFTSSLFKQVMQELGITHYTATAYHPQSQGALERFHQTFKSMLTKYCIENNKDWDEGVHFMLYAIRSCPQESLGFSPFSLVYGHTIRGPLEVMRECWLNQDLCMPLSKYVKKFRERLKIANEMARSNLSKAQTTMKGVYDLKAVEKNFKPGDLVLAFLPLYSKPFQSKYSGPFVVKEKLSNLNYLIKTPGGRKGERKIHANLLKLYRARDTGLTALITKTDSENRHSREKEILSVESCTPLLNSHVLCNPEIKFSHLSQHQKEDFCKLLSTYEQIFGDVPQPCRGVEHDIVLIDNATPVKQHPYRVNPCKRSSLRKEVEFLIRNGLAEQSTSEWASPCLLVPKPDGSDRLCTDYRRVNSLTKADCFPLPRMADIIDDIGDAKFITKLDLLKGYYQIPLTARAKEVSAFVLPDGLYQYKVMPFGMRNAPATFQRLMNHVIQDLPNVRVYIDDLVIFTTTWEEHVSCLQQLFHRLAEAGLTVNLLKSELGHAEVIYLGHVVGRGKVAPVQAKVEAILQYPTPTNRKEVMRFLGMTGFYRRFCPNFADVSAPLTALVSPKKQFVWSEKCRDAFNNLKNLLTTVPVLRAPDFSRPFSLQVDASDVGTGAVLMQSDEKNVLHPVSFMSTKFKPYQRHYSTIEKETLALLLALEKFEVYVSAASCPLQVFSDHNPLQFVNKMKNKNQRLMRWAVALQPYNLIISHIRGKDNVIADALSRVHSVG